MKGNLIIIFCLISLSCQDYNSKIALERQVEYDYLSLLGIEISLKHLTLDKHYNNKGQLIKEEYYNSDRSFYDIKQLEYDQNGFLVTKIDSDYSKGITSNRKMTFWTTKYIYNGNGKLSKEYSYLTPKNSINRDRMVNYVYNDQGILIKKNNTIFLYTNKDKLQKEITINNKGDTISQKLFSYIPNGVVKSLYDYNLLVRKDSVIYDEDGKMVEEIIYNYSNHINRKNKKYEYYKNGLKKSIYVTEVVISGGEIIPQNHLKSKLVYEYE